MKKYLSSYWIRSAFYTLMQRFSLTFFGLLNFALLTRMFSDDKAQFGTWALFLVIISVFEATKSNLLKNAHIRFVTATEDKVEKSAIASSSFLINAALNLLFIVLIVLFADGLSVWFNTGTELGNMLKWFIPGLAFTTFFSHFEAVQQSHLDFKGGFAGNLVRQLIFFGVIVFYFFSKTPLSLTTLVMYQSLSIIIGSIVLYFYSRRYLLHRFNASMHWITRIIGYGKYIFSSGMMANICANLDQLMIGKLMLPGYVSYYSVANRINNFIDIPSYAAAEVIFPQTSRASVSEGPERVKYMFEKMVAVLMCFTVPIAIFIIIFPKFVTTIIAGNSYAEAALILQLYMITGIFRPVQNQAANLLNSIGKPGLTFFINALYLLALLGINYICLLQFGFYGVAIGTLITAMLSFVVWYFVMKKQINLDMVQVFKYSIETYKNIFNKLKLLINRKQSA